VATRRALIERRRDVEALDEQVEELAANSGISQHRQHSFG
jgi:hypothetical protein